MPEQDDSDFDSALKWSHNHLHHPPKETGVNWVWVIIIAILLLLAVWIWWSNYGKKREETNSSDNKPMSDLEKGAKSKKDNYMTVDKSGRATVE